MINIKISSQLSPNFYLNYLWFVQLSLNLIWSQFKKKTGLLGGLGTLLLKEKCMGGIWDINLQDKPWKII